MSGPERPHLRARYDVKRQAVLDAAAEVIADRGFHATSMGDLTAATGLAAGGLYHYIASKDALLLALLDELMDGLLEQAEAIAADEATSPAGRLRALLRAWLSHVEGHRHHMRVFAQEWHHVRGRPEARAVRARRDRFESILSSILRDARPHDDDRRVILLAVLGMVNYTPQWFDPSGRLSAAQVADGYAALLLDPGP